MLEPEHRLARAEPEHNLTSDRTRNSRRSVVTHGEPFPGCFGPVKVAFGNGQWCGKNSGLLSSAE
jgi:hypothetical protein